MDIIELLTEAYKMGTSDILFSVDSPPMLRMNGELKAYGTEVLTPDITKRMIYSILNDEQKAKFEETFELDLSISIRKIGRFRINVFKQKGHIGAAFRTIMAKIPTFDELELPFVCRDFINYQTGLVLVTGPTGSGKSTTLAAMIDAINSQKKLHIITIEDPIEFVHNHKECIIDQRQLERDTKSFPAALKYVLRQDPDVILIGEMRDLETIKSALTIAETGHLVFATLHTQSAAQTIDRIVDVFPPHQQEQIRTQLSLTLKSVVSQQLLPKIGGGRAAAREIMVVNPAISNLIRESKTFMINNAIQTGRKEGMITMDDALKELVRQKKVAPEVIQSRLLEKGPSSFMKR